MKIQTRYTLDPAVEYELFGYPHTTQQDCDFLESILEVSGQPAPDLLDIACGTGRHALEMAQRGYAVTGIDISEAMLSAAGKHSRDAGLDSVFQLCDMRELPYHLEYDFAYSLFNTMGLLVENDEVNDFLAGVHDALRPGGLFLFQVGNLWSYIAEGNFLNSVYESEAENNGVKRKLRMNMVIGPYNNVYRMHYDKQYWREGVELTPRSEDVYLRA
ncbi:MAG: class I SAM-dependent methyltransferase, partial [Anaerolineae bacterium]|nr:class I SAM-dependent methyltransferase [Anaerolineae bacterium]